MAAKNTARAGDYTGRKKAELAKAHAEEQAAAAQSIAMATAAAAVEDKEPVVLTPKKEPVAKEVVGEVAVTKTDVNEEIVTFRVNETLEQVTIGHAQHYDFEEGRTYKAPRRIYNHLEEKGLIWH